MRAFRWPSAVTVNTSFQQIGLTAAARDINDARFGFDDLILRYAYLQAHSGSVEVFLLDHRTDFPQARFHAGELGEIAAHAQACHDDEGNALGQSKAFGRGAPISACQTTRAELDAAVPAGHDNHDPIHTLSFDGLENRAPGCPARFAVVIEAVILADSICPAVVRRRDVAYLLHVGQRLRRRFDRRGLGEKAAFANLLAMTRSSDEGVQRLTHTVQVRRSAGGHLGFLRYAVRFHGGERMTILLLVFWLVGYGAGRFGWHRCRWFVYGLTLILFLAAGCGPLPTWLLSHLQAPYATRPDVTWTSRNAIVLLGAGTARVAVTEQVEPNLFADGRILEAYVLYRSCKQSGGDCKLVVSGGDAFRHGVPEAVAYADVLKQLSVAQSDLMLESRSMNTWQNAEFVRPLLNAYAPQRVVLVSSAVHLNRARAYFAHFGVDVIPVRGDYADVRMSWRPNSWNMALTDIALHEYFGVLTYHVYSAMGWNAPPPSRYGAP